MAVLLLAFLAVAPVRNTTDGKPVVSPSYFDAHFRTIATEAERMEPLFSLPRSDVVMVQAFIFSGVKGRSLVGLDVRVGTHKITRFGAIPRSAAEGFFADADGVWVQAGDELVLRRIWK